MIVSATIITILYIQVALVLLGILIIEGGTWRLKAPTGNRSIRDIIGQFSWGRLHRPSGGATEQSIDTSVGVLDGSQDRGRRNMPKSAGKKSTPGMSVYDNGATSRPAQLKKLAVKMLWYPTGTCHIFLRSSRSEDPFVAYLVLILPLSISRIDPRLNISLDVLLAFTCLFLFMVRHKSWRFLNIPDPSFLGYRKHHHLYLHPPSWTYAVVSFYLTLTQQRRAWSSWYAAQRWYFHANPYRTLYHPANGRRSLHRFRSQKISGWPHRYFFHLINPPCRDQ
jgi:hypothetical protein